MTCLGDNLRRRREFIGYSVFGVAERSHVHGNLIRLYEASVMEPDEDELARLAQALGTDVADLRSGVRPRLTLIHGGKRRRRAAIAAGGPEAA